MSCFLLVYLSNTNFKIMKPERKNLSIQQIIAQAESLRRIVQDEINYGLTPINRDWFKKTREERENLKEAKKLSAFENRTIVKLAC